MARAFPLIPMGMVACALFLAPFQAHAQAAQSELEQQASAAIANADWSEAYRLSGELTLVDANNPAAWFQLGLSALNSGKPPAEAIIALEKARELGFGPAPTLYNIARASALSANLPAALSTLNELAELGPSRGIVNRLQGESAFDSLRTNQKFADLITRLTPCSSAAYRQFDYWLGTWNVVSPTGQALGTNTVAAILDGCMLTESWESTGGSKGFSINYYDNATDSWTQTYRDNTGIIASWPNLIGGLQDGAMVLNGSTDAQNLSRWTWTKISDDKVRQMAESSADGGKTWQVVWDSYYERAAE